MIQVEVCQLSARPVCLVLQLSKLKFLDMDQWNPSYPYRWVLSILWDSVAVMSMPADPIAIFSSQFQNLFGRSKLMMFIFVFHLGHLITSMSADRCKIQWTKDRMSTPNITRTKNRNWPRQKLYMDLIHGVFLRNVKTTWIFFWDQSQRLVQLSQDRRG